MANLFLGWPNRIDAATLSGGSWEATLPLANLQMRSLAVMARSTDDANASTKLNIDLGASHSLRAVGVFNHNLSSDAQIRVSLGTSSGGTQVYAGSWVDCFPITFGTGSDEWQTYNWWQPLADDDYIRNPFPVIVTLPSFYSARYVTIEFDDTSNTDGYVEFGRLFVGGGFNPDRNASMGLIEGYISLSNEEDLESGATIVWPKRSRKTARMSFDALSMTEFGAVFEMLRRSGTHAEILYVPSVSDSIWTQRSGFLGRIARMNPVAYSSYRMRATVFELVEIL